MADPDEPEDEPAAAQHDAAEPGDDDEDPAHGIAPMPSPEGVEGATDFSVIDE